MAQTNKNLLILGRGDSPEADKSRVRLVQCATQAGFDVQTADYHELEELLPFRGDILNVFPFFPYTFWNKYCEIPEDTRLYGTSKKAYGRFKNFLFEMQGQLETKFHSYDLRLPFSLKEVAADRDKIQTVEILKGCNISTAETVPYTNLLETIPQVTSERGVFIKCRYGAEGKGITLVRSGKWITNYKIEGRRLANYGTYDRWNFTDITGKDELLEQLLDKEVIIEREIISPNCFNNKKFDMRVYVVDGKVPHFFVRINDLEKVITNWSQGGKMLHHPETGLPDKVIASISQEARRGAEAFHSRLMGVDVMLDKSDSAPKVIELQAFTGFPDIRKFNLLKYLIDTDFFH